MISRSNLVLAFAAALAGLSILAVVTGAVGQLPRRNASSKPTEGAARDGLTDAMTFSVPAGAKP